MVAKGYRPNKCRPFGLYKRNGFWQILPTYFNQEVSPSYLREKHQRFNGIMHRLEIEIFDHAAHIAGTRSIQKHLFTHCILRVVPPKRFCSRFIEYIMID